MKRRYYKKYPYAKQNYDLFNPVKAIRVTGVIIMMMALIGLLVKLTNSFAIAFGIFVSFFVLLLFWDKINLESTPREIKEKKRNKRK